MNNLRFLGYAILGGAIAIIVCNASAIIHYLLAVWI